MLPDGQDLRRKGMRRFLITLRSHAVVMAVVWGGTLAGLGDVPRAIGVTLFTLVTLVGFYLLLRRGTVLTPADPVLAFSQAMFSIALVALVYALFEASRNTALLWLTVIIAYDIRRLPERQIRLAVGFSLLLPALVIGLRGWLRPETAGWFDSLLNLALLAVAMAVLITLSARARSVRRRDLEQRQQMARTLAQRRELSIRDALTGLYNRRHMLTRLDEEQRRQQRDGVPLCVALLDIDHFKQVNDHCGHPIGDAVLQRFAQLAQAAFPGDVDALARWGGEEFLLLMPATPLRDAEAAVQRLRDAVHGYDWGQHHAGLAVTFSAGVCLHLPECNMAETLEQADRALYQAKALGRDRVVVHGKMDHDGPQDPSRWAAARQRSEAQVRVPDLPPQPLQPPVADAPPPAPERRPAFPRLADLVLGTDRRVRAVMPMCLLSSAMYVACITVLLAHLVPAGRTAHWSVWVLLAQNMIGCVVPPLLVRSGFTSRWRDPAITLPYVLWAGAGLTVAYAIVPMLRGAVLQMLSLVMVFGFMGLRPRQTKIAGGVVIAMLAVMAAVWIQFGPAWENPRRIVLEVSMSAAVLWLLTLQSHNHSSTRERVRRERDELAAAVAQVERLMMRDPLTGLFNRQYMQLALERECARHMRSGAGFCVALIDLDHFKRINDTCGHHVGDAVLIGFAEAARAALRETDVICRWGGEEFLVLLPHPGTLPGPAGLAAVDRLREHVAAQRFCAAAPQVQVTFSAGVALHAAGEGVSELVARADHALYQAKADGRDRCVLAA
ncbi:diguanylate cyclase [Caldimonas brevitalea]|uniref:diguanylate cyclase n=1 Tax=Caldimonas brevitalea TaxID=413882 RepID=A0A0G3BQD4_9BURK|nr:diguanylate cyclase [Caldimonas brevitalea]